jgi:cytochrome c
MPRRKQEKSEFMKSLCMVVAAILCAVAGAAAAIDVASRDEAVAMVKNGIAFIKANGTEKGYAEITSKKGRFQDRDLYLVVYGMDGTVHADGANEKMVGRNLIGLKDIDGKPFVRERVELARSKGAFWQDTVFANPVRKAVEPKQIYCETLDDTVVCGGVARK